MTTLYSFGEVKAALPLIGATGRQLSYLVTKGVVQPSTIGRQHAYSALLLKRVFLLLGPLKVLELEARDRVSQVLFEKMQLSVSGPVSVDLDASDDDRNAAVTLHVDMDELRLGFMDFLARVSSAQGPDLG